MAFTPEEEADLKKLRADQKAEIEKLGAGIAERDKKIVEQGGLLATVKADLDALKVKGADDGTGSVGGKVKPGGAGGSDDKKGAGKTRGVIDHFLDAVGLGDGE